MTPAALKAWREHLYGTGYGTRSKERASEALGLSQRAYDSYEAGEHKIPRHVELACRALAIDHTFANMSRRDWLNKKRGTK